MKSGFCRGAAWTQQNRHFTDPQSRGSVPVSSNHSFPLSLDVDSTLASTATPQGVHTIYKQIFRHTHTHTQQTHTQSPWMSVTIDWTPTKSILCVLSFEPHNCKFPMMPCSLGGTLRLKLLPWTVNWDFNRQPLPFQDAPPHTHTHTHYRWLCVLWPHLEASDWTFHLSGMWV